MPAGILSALSRSIRLSLTHASGRATCSLHLDLMKKLRGHLVIFRSERDPYRPYFAYGAAFALLLAKQPIDALPFVEEAVHERPNSRAVRLLQAQVAAQAGDAPLAALARAAAEDLPRTPDAFAMQLPLPEDGRSILRSLAPERAVA